MKGRRQRLARERGSRPAAGPPAARIEKTGEPEPFRCMRLLLSEACNQSCPSCFNSDFRVPRHMDTALCIELMHGLAARGIPKLRLMGGEPTLHPDFDEILGCATRLFPKVVIYTNGTTRRLASAPLEKNTTVVVNFTFASATMARDLASLAPRIQNLNFEMVVGKDTDTRRLLDRVRRTAGGLLPHVNPGTTHFVLTLDCLENPVEHRERLNRKWREVVRGIREIDPRVFYLDHRPPACFWTPENRELLESFALPMGADVGSMGRCRPYCPGLIDSQFRLRHCNQHPVVVASLLDGKRLVGLDGIPDLLRKANAEKLEIARETYCAGCDEFPQCNGGCFAHKFPQFHRMSFDGKRGKGRRTSSKSFLPRPPRARPPPPEMIPIA